MEVAFVIFSKQSSFDASPNNLHLNCLEQRLILRISIPPSPLSVNNISQIMETRKNPLCVLLFSGKRKSGKDFFTDKIIEVCADKDIVVIKISAPIKTHFAKHENLNLKELMGDGKYKETYRKEMINWSDKMRKQDPGIFCKSAVDLYNAQLKKVWIVSDIRRKTDIKWFKDNFGDVVKTVRIEADCEVRKARGWSFEHGVDDMASECDLDDYHDWDWVFDNSGVEDKLNENLKTICDYLKQFVV